jgi:hypothetical protein
MAAGVFFLTATLLPLRVFDPRFLVEPEGYVAFIFLHTR